MKLAWILAVAFAVAMATGVGAQSVILTPNGSVIYGPHPAPLASSTTAPTPTPSPTPVSNAYQLAVEADAPYLFLRMNSATGTETDLGSGGNNATYNGTGTQAGPALDGDVGSGSFSPLGASGNYLEITSPLTAWPSTNFNTLEAGFVANSSDCSNGASLFNTWAPNPPATNNGTFSLDIVHDNSPSGCHVRMTSDNGGNAAACPAASLTTGVTHFAYGTYNRSTGLTLYVDPTPTSTPCGTQGSTYPAAWSNATGPVMVGQFASRASAQLNVATNTFILQGQVADVSMYTTNLSVARMAAHYAASQIAATPAPTPLAAPSGLSADAALCINGLVNVNVLPTIPPGFGAASGHPAGEFGLSGYSRTLFDTYWGNASSSSRIGNIGASFSGVLAHLTSPVALPIAMDGATSIAVDTASPAGISNGSTIEVGVSPGEYSVSDFFQIGGVYSSTHVDPVTIIGTLCSGYGTKTWNLCNVRTYSSITPVSTATTIPVTSPAYGTATKIYAETALNTWNGGSLSFGKSDSGYDNYLSITGDGSGLADPFTIGPDTDVAGSPQAVSIAANPMPAAYGYPNDPAAINLDNFTMTHVAAGAVPTFPPEGGSIDVNVADPTHGQNNWPVSIGQHGSSKLLIGTLASGGCDNQSGCGVASNPWHIVGAHYPHGAATGSITASAPMEFWSYLGFWSGTIDKELDIQFGHIAANVRLSGFNSGMSEAFWTFQTQAGFSNISQNSLTRNEADCFEKFSNTSGTQVNSGNLLWNYSNTGGSGDVAPYWAGLWSPSTDASANYHSFACNWAPGGQPTPFPTPFASKPGDIFSPSYDPSSGDSLYADGLPVLDHTGTLDLTQGVSGKEVMATFQIGGQYGFLSPHVNVSTTTTSTVIPAAYASLVTIGVTSTSNWVQQVGKVYDICTPSCSGSPTAYMHGLLEAVSGNNLTFWTMEGGGSAGYHDHGTSTIGSTLPIGSQVTVVDGALGQAYPQFYHIQWIRPYKRTNTSC